MLSSISKATHHGCLIASSVSRHRAASSLTANPSSCRQAAIRYNNYYFRGVSSQAAAAITTTVPSIISRGISLNLNKNLFLHRRAISSTSYIARGSTNSYYYHQNNNYSQQKRSQRVFLEIALFSSALYGATYTTAPFNATNETKSTATTTALCSNKDSSSSNDNDEDFISKVKSKINSQSISELSSSLPIPTNINMNMDDLLTTLGTQTQLALNSGIPTNLSYGFFAGYLSGFALKKIGRVASLSLGVGFVILQTLGYQGYIDVNHDKLASEVERVLDRNGDGVVDGTDLKSVVEELREVVGFGIEGDETMKATAGMGGFGMGFLGGLRSG